MRKHVSKFLPLIILTTLLSLILSKKLQKTLGSTSTVAIDVAKYSNICLRALMTSLNPNICVKSDEDAKGYPEIKICPKGSTEEKGLCFAPCAVGYKLQRAHCVEQCITAESDKGQFCLVMSKLIPKKSYFADIVPYESATVCKDNYFKLNGLCYRDCKELGMFNCGTEICTDKAESCTAELKDIVKKVSEQLHKALELIANCKTEKADIAAIKEKIKSELSSVTLDYLKKALKDAYAEATGSDKEKLFDAAVAKLKISCESSLNPFSKLSFLSSFCSTVYDYLLCQTNPEDAGVTKSTLVDSLDVMYLSEKTAKCKETCNGAVSCAENIFSKLKTNDATGILALGGGLFFETCPLCIDCDPDATPFYAPKVPNVIKPDCVYIYENSNFAGNYLEFCADVSSISSLNAQSLITGANVHVVVFHSVAFKNGFFGVGKGQYVSSLNDGNYDTYGLKFVNVNSIKILKNDCLHIISANRVDVSLPPKNHVINTFCKGDVLTGLSLTLTNTNNFFFFKSFSLTQRWKIYDKNSAKTYTIEGQTFLDNVAAIGFNVIGKIEFL